MGRKLTKTIFGICALTAAVHACNKMITKNATKKELLDYSNGKTFNTSYGKMFYKVYGTGTPLVLVHDISICSSGYEWNNVVKYLSKKFKLYIVDLPGCGRSTKMNISYNSYMYIQVLTNFINNVIGEKVDIVASGKSIPLVLKMYEIDNSLISKIVAISPEYVRKTKYIKIDKLKEIKNYIIESPIIGTAIYNHIASKKNIEELFTDKYYYNESKIRTKDINAFYESAHLSGANSKFLNYSLFNNYIHCNSLNVLNLIDELKIICGKEDDTAKKVISQFESHAIRLNYNYIDNAKKMPHLECPNYVSKVISEFLI